MKNILLGAIASLFAFSIAATSASAGAVGPALAPIDWSGPNLSVQAGYGWGQSEMHNAGTPTSTGNYDLHGANLGVGAGYNWQLSNLVAGVDTDISLATTKGTSTTNCGGGCTTELRWLGTLRGKVSYPMGKFLPYVTGGLAVGDVKASLGAQDYTKTRFGWTAGAGLAYGFTTGFSIKAEYLYTDLGNMTFTSGVPVVAKASDFQTFRVGLSFGF